MSVLMECALGMMPDYRMHWLVIAALCAAFIVVCIFVGIIIYLVNQREKLQFLFQRENEYREEERQYYLKLLQKEDDTRAFRHDSINHLLTLDAKLEKNDVASAREYIHELNADLENIQHKVYDVGNETINTIVNYYLNDERIHLKVDGYLGQRVPMREADLCIVISNVVKNALEAVWSLDGEKEIQIVVRQGRDTFLFRIGNPYQGKLLLEDGKIKTMTTKKDQKNHGIGLKNVERIMKKNDGEFWYEEENHYIWANILLRK